MSTLLEAINQINANNRVPTKSKPDFSKQSSLANKSNNSGQKPFVRKQTNREPGNYQQAPYCLKCKTVGHLYQNCNDKTPKVFCYRCGADNVVSNDCNSEYCRKITKN